MRNTSSFPKRATGFRLSHLWDMFQSDLLDVVICEASNRSRRAPRPVRLEIEQLEKRWLMAGSGGVTAYTASGYITPGRLILDSSGNIWATSTIGLSPNDPNTIIKFTPGGSITTYTLNPGESFYDLAPGSDGNLWAVDSLGYIDKLNPANPHLGTSYQLDPGTYGSRIVPGPNGNLWFTQSGATQSDPGKIRQITTSGAISDVISLSSPLSATYVSDMTWGPDGNLWFTTGTNLIGRLTPVGHQLTTFPTLGSTKGITVGPDGAMWYTDGLVGRMDLGGKASEFSLGSSYGTGANYITTGADGNLWFTYGSGTQTFAPGIGHMPVSGVFAGSEDYVQFPSGMGFSSGILAVGKTIWFSCPQWGVLYTGQFGSLNWLDSTKVVGDDPVQRTQVRVGADQLDPATGNLTATEPLDGGLSAPGCGCNQPALVYTTTSTNYPIFQTVLISDPGNQSLPNPLALQMRWDYSANWAAVPPFSPGSGNSPTDIYLMDFVAPVAAPQGAGLHSWEVEVTVSGVSGGTVVRDFTGAFLEEPSVPQVNTFGTGWGLAGDDYLFLSGGATWVSGSGGSRYFYPASTPTTFTSPANDFGALTENQSSNPTTITYTAVNQTTWTFEKIDPRNGSIFLLTKIVDPHGLAVTFTYNSLGQVMTEMQPDGGLLTFGYNSNNLVTTISEPGGRTLLLTYTLNPADNKYDLTGIQDADGNLRTLAYNSHHGLTSDQWSPLNAAVSYDPTSGYLVTVVDDGGGTLYRLFPAAERGFASGPITTLSSATAPVPGTLTDPLNHATLYTLDGLGRWTSIQTPVGTTSRTLDFAGNPTLETDALGHMTTKVYAYGLQDASQQFGLGDLMQVTNPDGGITSYLYDNLFHQVTETIDPRGNPTRYAYNAQGDLTTLTNALGKITTSAYSNGLLLSTTDPLGHSTSYDYCTTQTCPSARLVKDIRDAYGNVTASYTYDQYGNVYLTQDALGHITTTNYDLMRRLTSEQFPDGGSVAYTYNAQGQVLTKTDQLGTITSTAYDVHGWPTTVTEAVGIAGLQRSTVTTYDLAGNVLSVTDPRGTVTSYGYDAGNRQITLIQDYGDSSHFNYTTTTTYDAAGNVLSTTDPRHLTTAYLYDVMNRQVSVTQAQGRAEARTTTMLYDLAGNVLSRTDGNGVITSYDYDVLNRQTTALRDYGNTNHFNYLTTTAYDPAGNVLSVSHTVTLATGQSPVTLVTSYSYDLDNRQTTLTEAYGTAKARTTVTVYDLQGNVLSVQDPLGNVTSYGYDVMNRRNQTIEGYGTNLARTTTTVYDLSGNVLSTTDFQSGTVTYDKSRTTSYSYDKLNRLKYTIIGYGGGGPQQVNRINTYDADNNVTDTSETWTTGSVFTTYLYDALNRKVQMTEAGGRQPAEVAPLNHAPPITSWSYDADGNRIATTDPLGDITTNAYDGLNRLVSTLDARGGVTTLTYDANDNLLSVQDAQNGYHNRTVYQYDALNRKIQVTDPLNNKTTFVYNADDLVLSTTDRDQRRIDYAYDTLDRLTTAVWYSAIPNVNPVNTLVYSYDADDNLLTAQDAHGLYTMTYDVLNRLATEQEPFGMGLTLTYDAAGNRTLVQDYTGTTLLGTTTSVYDRLGELTSRQFIGPNQAPVRIDLTYNMVGLVTSATRYGDLTTLTPVGSTSMVYDALKRLAYLQHQNGSGTVLANYTYTYDIGSRLATENSLVDGTTNYQYDATNELTTTVNATYGTHTYVYDLNGNRQSADGVGYTTAADNRLQSDGTWNYTYDAEGNLSGKSNLAGTDNWVYTYDNRNQMVTAQEKSGSGVTLTLATYTYDVFGNRIEKDVWQQNPGTTTVTRFAYDGQEVWADLDGNSNLLVRYIHGDAVDQLFARVVPGAQTTVTWYLTDRLGSVRDLMNQAGMPIDHLYYDGFGNIPVGGEAQPANGDRYKFTGRELDSETGLQYNRARPYDAPIGRFTCQAPLGLGPDTNPYRYTGNDPTNYLDPSGLEDKAYWQALAKKGLTIPAKTFDDAIKNNKIITGNYAEMYTLKPKVYKWPGLAAYASYQVGQGLQTARTAAKAGGVILFGAPSTAAAEILAGGNLAVYQDVYWQFLAYYNGGIKQIEQLKNEIPSALYYAWCSISDGEAALAKGDEREGTKLIIQGNMKILRYEQENIVQKNFDSFEKKYPGIGRKLSPLMGQKNGPLPGVNFFRSGFGNINSFDDRWRWISEVLWPEWLMYERNYPGDVATFMRERIKERDEVLGK